MTLLFLASCASTRWPPTQSPLTLTGLFFSARAFFAKASYSFGHLFGGLTLDWFVKLPYNAVPGELAPEVLTRLGLTAVRNRQTVAGLFCWACFAPQREREYMRLSRGSAMLWFAGADHGAVRGGLDGCVFAA